MSAFVVSNDHIDALITYCLDRRVSYWTGEDRVDVTRHNAEEVGRILLDENVRSVVYRYENTSPDFADEAKTEAAAYSYRRYPHCLSPVQVIKAVHCLEYQCCETNDWEQSLAWKICQAIIAKAAHDLPGYEEAVWEINRERAAP